MCILFVLLVVKSTKALITSEQVNPIPKVTHLPLSLEGSTCASLCNCFTIATAPQASRVPRTNGRYCSPPNRFSFSCFFRFLLSHCTVCTRYLPPPPPLDTCGMTLGLDTTSLGRGANKSPRYRVALLAGATVCVLALVVRLMPLDSLAVGGGVRASGLAPRGLTLAADAVAENGLLIIGDVHGVRLCETGRGGG